MTFDEDGLRVPAEQREIERPRHGFDARHRAEENQIAARMMASILRTRLREVLREDLGGTYSVSASASLSYRPIGPFGSVSQ